MINLIKPRQDRRRMRWPIAPNRRVSQDQPDRFDLQADEAAVAVVPLPTRTADFPWTQADAMYLLLVRRADQLRACRADPAYEEEIDGLWNAIDAYEARRWADQPSEAA